jgi:hypothetical protein
MSSPMRVRLPCRVPPVATLAVAMPFILPRKSLGQCGTAGRVRLAAHLVQCDQRLVASLGEPQMDVNPCPSPASRLGARICSQRATRMVAATAGGKFYIGRDDVH